MKKYSILILSIAVLLVSACKSGGSYKNANPKTSMDSVSYAVGLQIASQLRQNGLDSTINPELLARAIYDVMNSKKQLFGGDTIAAVLMKQFNPQAYQQAEFNKKKEKDFFAKNGTAADVKTTSSGLQYQIISTGTGQKPTESNTVKVHYKGMLLDSTVFDSSIDRKEPAVFPLANLIQGWKEGILLMPVGSKFKFFVPSKLAYGMQGIPQAGIGPNEPLIFEVELISIEPDAPQMNPMEMQQEMH
jgi:FKBP-type peptidyl-prolyl cis-trans isomerase